MAVSADSSLSRALKVSAEKAVGLSTTCCPLRLTATTRTSFQTVLAKCICLKFLNFFVSNCKMYLFQIAKCICLKLRLTATTRECFQTLLANCICLKLLNVFVSNCKLYLSQITQCVCLKLQNVFIFNCD